MILWCCVVSPYIYLCLLFIFRLLDCYSTYTILHAARFLLLWCRDGRGLMHAYPPFREFFVAVSDKPDSHREEKGALCLSTNFCLSFYPLLFNPYNEKCSWLRSFPCHHPPKRWETLQTTTTKQDTMKIPRYHWLYGVCKCNATKRTAIDTVLGPWNF